MWFAGLAITPAATPWHVAQEPAATVGCLKVAPKNELVFVWQVSQPALVAICVAGLNNGVTPANEAPLWQLAQPVLMPAWFMVVPAKLVVDLWHVSQDALVGIWLAGLAKPAPPNLWQVAHPVVMPVWFIAAPPINEAVDLWQVSQDALV